MGEEEAAFILWTLIANPPRDFRGILRSCLFGLVHRFDDFYQRRRAAPSVRHGHTRGVDRFVKQWRYALAPALTTGSQVSPVMLHADFSNA